MSSESMSGDGMRSLSSSLLTTTTTTVMNTALPPRYLTHNHSRGQRRDIRMRSETINQSVGSGLPRWWPKPKREEEEQVQVNENEVAIEQQQAEEEQKVDYPGVDEIVERVRLQAQLYEQRDSVVRQWNANENSRLAAQSPSLDRRSRDDAYFPPLGRDEAAAAAAAAAADDSVIDGLSDAVAVLSVDEPDEYDDRDTMAVEGELECTICLIYRRAICCVPCGHIYACHSCSAGSINCAVCRAVIEKHQVCYM